MAPFRPYSQRAACLQEARERRAALKAALDWLGRQPGGPSSSHGIVGSNDEGEGEGDGEGEGGWWAQYGWGPPPPGLGRQLAAAPAASGGYVWSSGAGGPLGGPDFAWLTGASGESPSDEPLRRAPTTSPPPI